MLAKREAHVRIAEETTPDYQPLGRGPTELNSLSHSFALISELTCEFTES